jgi:hypothetical protein
LLAPVGGLTGSGFDQYVAIAAVDGGRRGVWKGDVGGSGVEISQPPWLFRRLLVEPLDHGDLLLNASALVSATNDVRPGSGVVWLVRMTVKSSGRA